MNTIYDHLEFGAVAECRNGFHTNYMTDPQFEMFVPMCAMLNREIHKSGSFFELLENLAFVASKNERYINADKAEDILRGLFKDLFGTTPDGLRQTLAKNLEALSDDQKALGYEFAKAALALVEEGDKIPFHRAFAQQAAIMATELSITDYAAKQIMSEQFEAHEEREFYETGKETEDKFYRPQIEAEKRKRQSRRKYSRNSNYTNG